jgi:hypothetical protein
VVKLFLLLVIEIEVMSKAFQFGRDLLAFFSIERHDISF